MGTLYAVNGNIINSQEPLPIPVNFMKKLWENPSPTADFEQQQITLSEDATNYEFLMVELKYMKSADYRYNVIGHTGNNIILSYGECGSKGAQVTQRNLYLVSGYPNKVLINNCELATGSTASTTSNDHCIPLAIYGFNTQVPMQSGGGGTKYDPETDMIYLWDGTQWVEWKSAGIKTPIPLIPEMTSNTSPKGSVSHTWGGTSATYCTYKNGTRELLNVNDTTFTPYCYYLFKGSNYGMNIALTSSGAQAFSATYEFSEPVSVINKVKIGAGSKIAFNSGYGNAGGVLTVKALDSNGVWNNIYVRTYAPTAANIDIEETLDIDSAYAKNVYGIKYDFTDLTGWGLYLYDLQVYGH